jgi:hypothetical protein
MNLVHAIMKTGAITEWCVVDNCGNSFAFRKTRKETRALLRRLDPKGIRGFRLAKVVVAR